MPFNYELAKQIFEEMGIEWDSNATELIVDGSPLPDHFDAGDLFGFNDDLPTIADNLTQNSFFSVPFVMFGERDDIHIDNMYDSMAEAA